METSRVDRPELATGYGLYFLPLQEPLNKAAAEFGEPAILWDGVHPTMKGAAVIANEWMKLFDREIDKA